MKHKCIICGYTETCTECCEEESQNILCDECIGVSL